MSSLEETLKKLLERVQTRRNPERDPKELTQFLTDTDVYDDGFNCVHGMAFDCDPCLERLSRKQRADGAEIARLKAGIRNHRDQKGDDRCYLDDAELYALLGEGPAVTALPSRDAFLANCARFHASRQMPGEKYETEADRHKALKDELYAFKFELWNILPELHRNANSPEDLLVKNVKMAFDMWQEDRERMCNEVLKVEWSGYKYTCLWCKNMPHGNDCPMFSAAGVVRLREI